MSDQEDNEITNATIGNDLYEKAILISGLCDVLLSVTCETISAGDFKNAQILSWSYECLANLTSILADKLSEVAP